MLGLPRALAVAMRGHRVRGYDADPRRMSLDWYPGNERAPDGESLPSVAARSDFAFAPIDEVVASSEIIFLSVQTPSAGSYDGSGPFPAGGVDYDLEPLRRAVAQVADTAARGPAFSRVLSVVSTVLPGTLRNIARGLTLASGLALAHTPEFSAVGSIMRDYLDPEFALVGTEDEKTGRKLKTFYQTITNAPIFVTNLENAEMIKTTYNGYIGIKIGFANALMEMAHKTPGCDVDVVSDCLALASRRLISSKYLRGGLGDGGGCHPKENAALSAFAKRLGLSYDPFGNNMASRDRQTEWIAELVATEHRHSGLPVWLIGTAFKADVTIEVGSPALLLLGAMQRSGLEPAVHDPLVPDRWNPPPKTPALFVIGTPHAELKTFAAPPGSIVIDPWNHVSERAGVRHVAVGRTVTPG